MEPSLLKRKRPHFDGYEEEPHLYTRSCLMSLVDFRERYGRFNETSDEDRRTSSVHTNRTSPGIIQSVHTNRPSDGRHNPQTSNVRFNKNVPEEKSVFDQILSSWTDTRASVDRVLERLKSGRAGGRRDPFLEEHVNGKFMEFYRDITKECGGVEDRQHSWAVLEKPDEIVMYGPYYPNYTSGEHSEDTVIKHTQELLDSDETCGAWSLYVFTQNSPCLARNTSPCMLNLVRKAYQWYSLYGLKTHIGYVRCWGFKGSKEALLRDLSYSRLDRLDVSDDYAGYLKAAQESTESDGEPLCEPLYSAIKQLSWGLEKGNLKFPLMPTVTQEQDTSVCFKSLYDMLDSESQDRREVLRREISAMLEAVQHLPLEENNGFEQHVETGRLFALRYEFPSQISDPVHAEIRLAFERCWREMVQDKYASFIRERLTEDFHSSTVLLFTEDIGSFTKAYVQIGRVQFSED